MLSHETNYVATLNQAQQQIPESIKLYSHGLINEPGSEVTLSVGREF